MVTRFKFWDNVYAKRDESRGGKEFPSSSNEIACRFVGFSESVGHPMTYKVLTSDTKKVLYRSRIRLASECPNPRADAAARMNSSSPSSDNSTSETFDDHSTTPVLQSRDRPMAVIDPNDIIGRTYLSTPEEDGTRMRLRIVEAIDNIEHSINQEDLIIRFRAENADGTYEEVQTINQILEKIEEEDREDNKTVVDSSANPASKLSKRHILLSYHRVREAIAAGLLNFIFIPGSINPADILSKAWGYQAVWPMLKALLFWEGNTMSIE